LQRKAVIGAEFASVLPVLQQCPHIFGDQVTHASFKHAYATGNWQGSFLPFYLYLYGNQILPGLMLSSSHAPNGTSINIKHAVCRLQKK